MSPALPAIAGQGPRTDNTSPAAIYEAYRHQRKELTDQIDRLQDQRRDISSSLQQENLNGVDQKNLEQRLVNVDQRIAATEKLLAESDLAVARAAAIPGAVVDPPPFESKGPPDEIYVLTGIFFILVLFPLSVALARRIWKRGTTAITKLPQEIYDRFARVDQSLDAIAVEVERIGEGQRFLTRMHAEQRAVGPGPAEGVAVPEREREKQGRPR